MLPFFKDDRYIKIDGKPLFIIYRPETIPCLNDMIDVWQKLSKNNGLPGLKIACQSSDYYLVKNHDDSRIDYNIEFQPGFSSGAIRRQKFSSLRALRRNITRFVGKYFGIDLYRYGRKTIQKIEKTNRVDYDRVWKQIISTKSFSEKNIPGAFVDWDNSPRYGKNAMIYIGGSPKKFEYYMDKQIKNAKENYKTDMMFMYAWNEWAEGGYLEPDERYGYGYLEALRNALIENGETPQ